MSLSNNEIPVIPDMTTGSIPSWVTISQRALMPYLLRRKPTWTLATTAKARSCASPGVIWSPKCQSPHFFLKTFRPMLSVEISGGKGTGDQNINCTDGMAIINVGRWRPGSKAQRASSAFLLEINNPLVMGRSAMRKPGFTVMRAPLEREKNGRASGLCMSNEADGHPCLCSFPRATVTKYYQFGGLKQHKFIVLLF